MKQIVKRLTAIALASCLALTALPGTALAAEETPTRGVLTYTPLIAPQYENASNFSEDLACVQKGGKWGYVNEENQVVIPFVYDLAYSFHEGLAVVGQLATRTRENVTYDAATNEQGETIESYDVYELSFINRQNKLTPFKMYKDAEKNTEPYFVPVEEIGSEMPFFYNGFVKLPVGSAQESAFFKTETGEVGYRYTNSFTLHNTKGEILDTPYAPAGAMTEGLCYGYLRDINGFGFFDAKGNTVLSWGQGGTEDDSNQISDIRSFNQGMAPAQQFIAGADSGSDYEGSYLWGFINRAGDWVIKPQFNDFFVQGIYTRYQVFGESGLACVAKDQLRGAIDKTGKVVIPFQYEKLQNFHEGLAAFQQNGKYGYLDTTGKVIIPAKYQNTTGFNNGYAVVYDGAKAFLIDRNGNSIPGADKLDPDTYFTEDGYGNKVVKTPSSNVVIKEGEQYGFGHISYVQPLPEKSQMHDWAFRETTAAIEHNLVPDYLQNLYLENITRSEFCSLVVQAVGEVLNQDTAELVKTQTGKDIYAWVAEYPFADTADQNVVTAYALGIVTGRGNGIFDPYATITRQEAAAFLMRSAKVLGMDTGIVTEAGFTDGENVGVWFKDAVNFVAQIKVMGSTGKDSFSPLGNYTREQSYVTIYRLFLAITEK